MAPYDTPAVDPVRNNVPGTRVVYSSDRSSRTEPSAQQLRAVVAELFMALGSMLDDDRDSAKEYLGRAAEMLHELERSQVVVGRRIRGGLAPWQVRKVKMHIAAHIDQPIRSRDLAAILRMDPCHFSRAFRNSFGDSPIDYLIRRRIERAQELMLSTDAPLSAIALECGLADQAHLSRLFRRTVGESPRAWRRARVTADPERLLAESLRVCSFAPWNAVGPGTVPCAARDDHHAQAK